MSDDRVSTFNLATTLTLCRFLLVPVFIYEFLKGNFGLAVSTLIVAAITDVTDGLLARRFNMGTKLGSILDPLADKFLMMISFIVLATINIPGTKYSVIPGWVALLVIGRDFYIVFGVMYLYFVKHVDIRPKPSILSKLNTFSQFCLLTLSFIKTYVIQTTPDWNEILLLVIMKGQWALTFITALMTTSTWIQYTGFGVDLLKNGKRRVVPEA